MYHVELTAEDLNKVRRVLCTFNATSLLTPVPKLLTMSSSPLFQLFCHFSVSQVPCKSKTA